MRNCPAHHVWLPQGDGWDACTLNNFITNPRLTSTISDNFFRTIKFNNNRHLLHLQCKHHQQHLCQVHLNHRLLRWPHQVYRLLVRFNPDEMLQQMKTTFEASLAARLVRTSPFTASPPQPAVPPGQFFVEVIHHTNSPKFRFRHKLRHFNSRMRCWTNNSTINLRLTSTTSNNFFLITKLNNNRLLLHLQCKHHQQHHCQLHLNHRFRRWPHQVHRLFLHHLILMRCCNKWRRPSQQA